MGKIMIWYEIIEHGRLVGRVNRDPEDLDAATPTNASVQRVAMAFAAD